ncbi:MULTISPECIES: extracellular solute-binding protein [unclassified Roseitalea]|uniref:ABC transporter substrate-binding protein n=1 Tax=unclassified Roseitalea TaxID=2639107 RepID=UPI00273E3D71|nr:MULTISPECIES: extracellular solute-binding protein [unclassified Roseitalea]
MVADTSALRGVAWDHRRCWGPLDASVPIYAETHGRQVVWERRSLYSFGEGNLDEYAARYDLVIFDHPFVGEAAQRGYLLDLTDFVTAADRERFAADSVGASWQSYWADDRLWALPIDAAGQTAAWRADLMDRHGFDVPATIEGVIALGEAARARGCWMAFPGKPTDLFCCFLSLAASTGETPGERADRLVSEETAGQVMELLRRLIAQAHPEARHWNPIQCFDHMVANDDIVYVPYAFNYINYATHPARPLTFGGPPKVFADRPARALLGGAGIGISAETADPEAAYAYAAWLCGQDFQTGEYVRAGGQPASRAAWQSAQCNALTGNFLANTLAAMDDAYLRPTFDGFVPLFREATHRITAVIHDEAPEAAFLSWLNDSYGALREGTARTVAAQ